MFFKLITKLLDVPIWSSDIVISYQADIYLFKVNSGNTICLE